MSIVSVRDSRQDPADRRWIEGIYREYLNDLSPQGTGLFPALGEIGHREPDQPLRWFADPTARVMTVLYGNERVGFAMVHAAAGAAPRSGPVDFSMGEFFIARPWRRRGIGQQAVRLILDRFTGRWSITEYLRNATAVSFWRAVVSSYTGGQYQERVRDGEVHQRFESGPQRGGGPHRGSPARRERGPA